MARKKSDPEAAADRPPESYIEQVARGIEKEYGKGHVLTGEEVADEPKVVMSLSPALDGVTSGGFTEGCLIGVTGDPKACKSSMALCLVARAQRPEYGSRQCYYFDVEARLSYGLLRGTAGLDLKRLRVIRSSEDRIFTAQEWLRMMSDILRDVPRAFIVIDSISALCEEREMADGVGAETRGGGAKLFSQFCRTTKDVVMVRKSNVLGITHLISNTSGMGPPKVERVANAWKYHASYLLRVVTRQAWKEGNRQVGYKVRWQCHASALGPPGKVFDSYVRFGIGIDGVYEAVQFGLDGNLIAQAGSWLTLDYLAAHPDRLAAAGLPTDELPKFQGADRVCAFLRDRPELYEPLLAGLREVPGLMPSGGDE